VEWDSPVWNGKEENDDNRCKADDSLKSFVFTLKNPNNIPARRFALKVEKRDQAIHCNSDCGPCFGYAPDVFVFDNCNENTGSSTYLGGVYTNDTEVYDIIVLTGSFNFQVKEIEVFEITD
jgi:hypothetical protein